MANTIRLKRVGAKKKASFRIVVIDSLRGTAGKSVERLGIYNPRTKPSLIRINAARTIYWLNEGAKPSDTVRSLLEKTGVWKQFREGVAPETLEEPVVFVGPPAGEQTTSHRPMPVDKPVKPAAAAATAAPAAKAAKTEEAEAPAEAPAVEAEEATAEAEATEAEAPEEATAEAAEEATAEVAEAEAETAEAEAETEEAEPAEAEVEAEEGPVAEAEAEADSDDEAGDADEESKEEE